MKPITAHQRRRLESQDPAVAKVGPSKSDRIDLGLALFQCHALPGVCYSRDEIANWAGCTDGAILLIEQKALRKLRSALLFRKDPVLTEAMEHAFRNNRQPAAPSRHTSPEFLQ